MRCISKQLNNNGTFSKVRNVSLPSYLYLFGSLTLAFSYTQIYLHAYYKNIYNKQ